MSKELAVKHNNDFGIDPSLWAVLTESIYPNAKPHSIKMAHDYCAQKKIDPLMKLVHLVPMNVDNVWRDVVMPGIGLYRLQAEQSGKYVGITLPEFGETITKKFGNEEVSYPAWCKITVRKLVADRVAEFTAIEYWVENYAKLKNSDTPNTMWRKRPYGQLAKCAEAQALRKAFPNHVSQEPTAEEMEGKTFDNIKDVTLSNSQIFNQKLDALGASRPTTPVNDDCMPPSEPTPDLSEEEARAALSEAIIQYNISQAKIGKWCESDGVESLEELPISRVKNYIDYIKTNGVKASE